jgi:H+/Cl- antiporter ClcA
VQESPALGWYITIGIIGGFLAYLGIGIAYNRRTYGSTGVESVPNIALWRALHSVTVAPIVSRLGGGHRALQQEEHYEYAATEEDGDIKVSK